MKSQDYAIFKRLIEQHEKEHHDKVNEPARQGETWTFFEHDLMMDSFNNFVKNRALIQGRSERAVRLQLLKLMGGDIYV